MKLLIEKLENEALNPLFWPSGCKTARETEKAKEGVSMGIAYAVQKFKDFLIESTDTSKDITDSVFEEYIKASLKFDNFNSYHEGWAVLMKEVDELWDLVKSKNPDKTEMKKEAIQIAAMAIRFINNLCK